MNQELKEFKVIKDVEVQWGEMDAAQHVNNGIYFRWGETSRIAYFDKMGFEVSGEVGFILGWQDCKYIRPVTYPDKITMGIKVVEVGKDFFNMETHFFSEKLNRLVAISKQKVVTYDYKNLCKVEVPDAMKKVIKGIEKD